jgi:hypothetical protein
VFAFVIGQEAVTSANIRGVHRELRRMTGYVVAGDDSVQDVVEKDFQKRLTMASGRIFTVDSLILGPFTVSDVIVFEKVLATDQPQRRAADASFRLYKLLIDDETVDARRVK